MEGWVDVGIAVKVRIPCPRLYIAAAVAINTTFAVSGVIRTWILSTRQSDALTTRPLRPSYEWLQWRGNGLCRLCNAQRPGGKGALLSGLQWNQFFAFRYRMQSNQLKSTVFYTHSLNTVVLALKEAEWPNCWFSNQPACTAEVV